MINEIDNLILLAQKYGKDEKDFCFEKIIKEYDKSIKNLLLKYKHCSFYEDLLQECYIEIYNLIDKFSSDRGATFLTFMRKVLVTRINRKLRYQTLVRIPEYLPYERNFEFVSQYTYDKNGEIEDIFETISVEDNDNTDLKLHLQEIKKMLSEKQLKTLDLIYKGYSYNEIAKLENTSYQAIPGRLRKIKNKLIKNGITL